MITFDTILRNSTKMSKHFMKYQVKKTNDESIYFLMLNLLYRYKHIIPVYYPNKKREYYKRVPSIFKNTSDRVLDILVKLYCRLFW